MNNKSGLTLLALAAAALSTLAPAAQSRPQNSSPNLAISAQLQVGPSFEDLVDKLRDLRERKKYDWAHGRKYQDYLAQKIEIVKRALRNHHGARGQKAAQNEGSDYSPPR